MKRIPVAGPSITQAEIDAVTDAVTRAWYGNANLHIHQFERAFADYLGVAHAVSLPSCTSAIHLALAGLGIGPGDEVIVPDVTWIATVAPVTYVGAAPVFADIDADTWCLSPASFEACITERTRAVIPVDLYGGMPDMDAIRAVARRHGIAVIEDAAEAIGSQYRGRKAGTLGHVGVFSFHGSKTMTTGEGGMLATTDPDLYQRVLVLRDHGRPPGDKMFRNGEVAFKYKMTSLQAALGLAQLRRIDELVAAKRRIFQWYRRELAGLEEVRLNAEPPFVTNSYWMSTVVIDPELGIAKEALIGRLSALGIETRPFFYPLSSLPAFASQPAAAAARARNPVGYAVSATGVNLPSPLSLTEGEARFVCDQLKSALREAQGPALRAC
jgi:perosamine synthetase